MSRGGLLYRGWGGCGRSSRRKCTGGHYHGRQSTHPCYSHTGIDTTQMQRWWVDSEFEATNL